MYPEFEHLEGLLDEFRKHDGYEELEDEIKGLLNDLEYDDYYGQRDYEDSMFYDKKNKRGRTFEEVIKEYELTNRIDDIDNLHDIIEIFINLVDYDGLSNEDKKKFRNTLHRYNDLKYKEAWE